MSDRIHTGTPSGDRTMKLLLLVTEDGDLPASEGVMDLIFAAASLMVAVHTGSGERGDLCPPMTANAAYNVAAQGVSELARSMLERDPEVPS